MSITVSPQLRNRVHARTIQRGEALRHRRVVMSRGATVAAAVVVVAGGAYLASLRTNTTSHLGPTSGKPMPSPSTVIPAGSWKLQGTISPSFPNSMSFHGTDMGTGFVTSPSVPGIWEVMNTPRQPIELVGWNEMTDAPKVVVNLGIGMTSYHMIGKGPAVDPSTGAPAILGNMAWIQSKTELIGVNLSTGTVVQRFANPTDQIGTPLVSNGALWLYASGYLESFNTDTGIETGRVPLPKSCPGSGIVLPGASDIIVPGYTCHGNVLTSEFLTDVNTLTDASHTVEVPFPHATSGAGFAGFLPAAVANGIVWGGDTFLTSGHAPEFIGIDLATGHIRYEATMPAGSGQCGTNNSSCAYFSATIGYGSLWVTAGQDLVFVNPTTGRVDRTIRNLPGTDPYAWAGSTYFTQDAVLVDTIRGFDILLPTTGR